MKFGNLNHGHESARHRTLKLSGGEAGITYGADAVRFEVGGCDGIWLKRVNGVEDRIGFEAELSPRNVMRNVMRDIEELNCRNVVVIAGSESVRKAIVAKLDRQLPRSLQSRVFVICADGLSGNFFQGIFGLRLRPAAVSDAVAKGRCPASRD